MKKALIAGLLAAIAAVAIVAVLKISGSGDATMSRRLKQGNSGFAGKSAKEAVRDAMGGAVRSGGAERRKRALPDPEKLFTHLTGEDRRLAEAVQNAIDSDDFEATAKAAAKAMASGNAEVRLNAVEALGWFGMDALPELTEAMADADEEVAEVAENAWELALSEIDDAGARFKIAKAALATLGNGDHLVSISGQLVGAALEMIDGEDDEAKAFDTRVEVVQSLVDIMDSGRRANAKQAEEAYEDITGNEWRGIDEAEKYLLDPENYELPEDREEDNADSDEENGDEEYVDSGDDGYDSTAASRSRGKRSGRSSSRSSSSGGFEDSGDVSDGWQSEDFAGEDMEGELADESIEPENEEESFEDADGGDDENVDEAEEQEPEDDEPGKLPAPVS